MWWHVSPSVEATTGRNRRLRKGMPGCSRIPGRTTIGTVGAIAASDRSTYTTFEPAATYRYPRLEVRVRALAWDQRKDS